MIGQVRGTLLEKQPPHLLIEVNGIGYEIDAPMSTFDRLPDVGREVLLYTHFVVREDGHFLYGFFSREERSLFRTVLKVNGVGPRLGLALLSSMSPDEFVRSVIQQDTNALVKLPGVGKKTAERLIIEMRDKLADWSFSSTGTTLPPLKPEEGPRNHYQAAQDAISALIALGYKPQEASRMVAKVDDHHATCEDMVRRALKEMI